ncbi:MAG TPA: alpha/beta fold hydrolase [Pyrinomonadaceae bacterium]|nr:alpha/beta fold hydrolase [Pyrinomonadaceae bacterium]
MTACTRLDAWVLPESESASRIRLFCFPYAGSSAQIFHAWQQELPNEIEVSPVHLPGRGKRAREKPFTDLLALAEVLTAELSPHVDKPYALFGHSVGATVAFEVARAFRREGLPLPLHLFVSGCRAPQLSHTRDRSYDLPTGNLIGRLRELNGTPSEILESLAMEFFLPIIRADLQMIQTYNYSVEAPLSCPISAFGGWQDLAEPLEMISAWREQTTSSFQRQMFAGDHFFLHSEHDHLLQTISQQLSEFIDATSL